MRLNFEQIKDNKLFSPREGGILGKISSSWIEKIRMAIGVALLFPIFFQASNGIFRDPAMYFNSGGVLANLPIPLSVFACYAGIVLLGKYKRAFVSFMTVFLTCILMVMGAIISTSASPGQEQTKLVLLIQFILPMFALALGQVYNSDKEIDSGSNLERMFLYVLAMIVPLQLVFTWNQGFLYLAPSLTVFSIYQHLQYVPVIFVSAYLIALFALWQLLTQRYLLLALAPLMGIYAAASMSMLAIGILLIGVLIFAIFHWISNNEKLPAMVFLLVGVLSFSYLYYGKDIISFKFGFLAKEAAQEAVAPNISERIVYWKYYIGEITTGPKTFFIGHGEAPDRSKYPSAHNYYLDFIYNFGLLALLPVLALLVYTCAMIYRHRRQIYLSPSTTGLCMVTLFLLLVDNSLKVGLRQPYPGIFTFFLWGLLLDCLIGFRNTREAIYKDYVK